jgi:hypothetical protein
LLPADVPLAADQLGAVGRTQLMLSPGKALIAGALVFGIGGVMLITLVGA